MTDTAIDTSSAPTAPAAAAPSVSGSAPEPSTPSPAPSSDTIDLDAEPVRDLDAPAGPRHAVKRDTAESPVERQARQIKESARKAEARDVEQTRQRAFDRARDGRDGDAAPRPLDAPGGEAQRRLQEAQDKATKHRDALEQEAQRRAERPQDMPRSFSNADAEVWRLTPEPLRKSIAEREKKREAHFLQAQEFTKRYTAAAEQHAKASEQLIRDALYNLNPELESYADIRTAEDVARLHVENPERAQQYEAAKARTVQLKQRADALRQAREAQHSQLMQQHQQHAQAQWRDWSAHQDAIFSQMNPNITNDDRREAREMLQSLGISQTEAENLWKTNPLFRSAQAQQVLYDAMMYRRSRAALEKARPLRPAKPQRPGTLPPTRSDPSTLEAYASRGDMSGYVKARNRGRDVELKGATLPRAPRR
jgi:hypothetical protein